MGPRILYVVTEDWYFLSHRLPMARAAKAAGYEVHVATRIKDGEPAIKREGFVPHALDWSRGSLSPRGSVSAVLELRRLIEQIDPDILHNVSLKPVLLGTTASLGFGRTAVVNSLTGLGTLFIGEAKVSAATRQAVRFALSALLRRKRSKIVVQNPDDWDFVLGLGAAPDNIALIPGSGVDTEHLTKLPEPPAPVTAAYVGRMLADKGVVTLIQAYSLLNQRGVQLQLLLAGDTDRENPGSLAPEQLREFASLYGIHWLGHVTDIRKVWAMAHFAVLASRREGLPKSLLEAAACGRPMVATNAPGCREIAIQDKTALTVPVDDVEALADAMARMAGDQAMRDRFGKAARALVEEKFSAEAIGREIVALYDGLRRT
ncbi:MAG: glycosyltransferase family 4 protein [Alphaproteobacteria bacterium]|nr:glycosyltransferase family 4 protein [Alphaproteobacteria bacterium]